MGKNSSLLITPVVMVLCGTAWAQDTQIAMSETPDSALYDLFGRRVERGSQNVDGSMPDGELEVTVIPKRPAPAAVPKKTAEVAKVESSKVVPSKAAAPTSRTVAAAKAVPAPKTATLAAKTAPAPKVAAAPAPVIAPTPAVLPKAPANAHAISWTQRYYTDVNSGSTGATHVVKSGNRVVLRSFSQ